MYKYFSILIIILLASLSLTVKRCQKLADDRDRLSSNQEALLNDIEFYRTTDSIHVASVQALTMTASELRKHNNKLLSDISKLDIKLKRLESASKTATENRINLTALRDTATNEFSYMTNFISFTGTVTADTMRANIIIYDTLTTLLYRIPKRFLGIPYGTKHIRQKVYNSNPNVLIKYTEYIRITK